MRRVRHDGTTVDAAPPCAKAALRRGAADRNRVSVKTAATSTFAPVSRPTMIGQARPRRLRVRYGGARDRTRPRYPPEAKPAWPRFKRRAMDNEARRTVETAGKSVGRGSTHGLRTRLRIRIGRSSMTPDKTSPSGDRRTANLEASLDRVHQDMEIIFRRMAGQPRPASGYYAVPPHSQAREAVPAQRRQGRLTAQVAVPAVLGCALLALVMGALASTERSDTSAPQVATASSSSETRPTETTSRPEAGADTPAPSAAAPTRSEPRGPLPTPAAGDGGEAVIRAFYGALGRGDGEEASAHVVAEKRSSRAFSPEAISSFYGGLPEPLRLTAITPLAGGTYGVSYRYSAGRSRCDGRAVVSLTSRDRRTLIRSIRALNNC